jgi:uncharacterized protein YodC (DUF2158 family)
MANETFKVGDTVELKSGGPKMGVANVDGENVRCEWSDGHVAHSAVFKAANLRKIDETPPEPMVG